MTSDMHPVRVRKNDAWVPIDTTLGANLDGSLSPLATTETVTFSGGGDMPMVTLSDTGRSLSFHWPASLPTPTVSGNSAVYPSVFPDVDLRLTAFGDGYSEVLVIKNATAAANPALTHLQLTATGNGLHLEITDDGHMSAVDSSGVEIFHGSTPVLWDSSSDGQVGPQATATAPGSGHISMVDVVATTPPGSVPASEPTTSTTELTLTPDPAALTGPETTYPVYFDPSMTGAKQHYATVTDNGGWHYYDDPNETARVGFCDWTGCNGAWHARSYFQINTTAIAGRAVTATIYSADFSITQIHNANACTAQPVDLYKSHAFNSSTAWGGPLTTALQEVSANFSDSCAASQPNKIHFTNANVISYVQDAANGDATSMNFALRAPNEAEKLQWKQFATDASLVVRYNFPPNAPTGLKVSNAVSCSGRIYTPDAFPTLHATATDNNPSPLQLNQWYEVWPTGGSARVSWSGGITTNSGAQASWTVNKPGGLGNADWSFRVQAENLPSDVPHLRSAWSGWYEFTSRANPITQTPWVASYDYPNSGYWGAPQGSASQKFLLNTNGAPDIVGFSYTWTGAGTEPALKTTDCNYNQTFTNGGWVAPVGGNATITVPPTLGPGYHTLHVRSFDAAHNLSPETSGYTFYVAPNVGVTTTRLEADNTTQVTVSQPAGQSVGLGPQTGNPLSWTNGSQELFQGTAVGQSFNATFTAPLEADYALGVMASMNTDYGKVRYDLDDVPTANTDTAPFDAYRSSAATFYRPLGVIHITAGPHTLTTTLVGTNTASTGDRYHAGIDFIVAIPINAATASSITDAMNNHGIAIDNVTSANLDLYDNDALSAQTLAAAGYAPGSTITVAGTTFTMPAPNTSTGNDNVIAAGQTIPLPTAQRVKSTAIGVLAVSTCGTTPAATGRITYSDSTFSSPLYAPVPDWISGSATAATVVLPHWNQGTAPGSSSSQPKVYAIFLAADPSKTPTSITLPYLGTSFMPNTCSRALHVLAIAPRPVATGWIGSWSATTEAVSMPPGGAGLANQTLRMIVHPTVTGANVRIRLSNTGSPTPAAIDHATIAAQSGTGAATAAPPAELTFCTATGQAAGCGTHAITLAAGGEAYSDPITMPDTTTGDGNISVSIHLPTAVTTAPEHTTGNTTNYLATGDTSTNQDGAPYTTGFTSSYYLTAIDVSTTDPTRGTIAILGDHTSANGAPGGTYQPTWIDALPAKLGSNLPGGLTNASLASNQTTAWWRAAETGAPLQHTIYDEPNLRTVIVTLGAQDLLQNTAPTTIEQNLTALMKGGTASAYGIKNHRRTDGSLIHVIIATIPPLGLNPTDQREVNRKQLNADILANYKSYGADDVVDFDQAVRDSTNPSNISPAYLSGTTPNSAYYNAVAQFLSDAVETFPPTAQL